MLERSSSVLGSNLGSSFLGSSFLGLNSGQSPRSRACGHKVWSQTLGISAIALSALGLVTFAMGPAIAQSADLQTLHRTLQQSVCRGEWSRALQLIDQMLAAPETLRAYREDLVAFQQQIQTYQNNRVQVDARQQAQCSSATQPSQPVSSTRPVDWDRAAASLSAAPRGSVAPAPSQARERSSQTAATCPPAANPGDRQVSSGSISNRWSYETYETRRGFYIRYWEQHDCSRVFRFPGIYDSQNAVRDAFVDFMDGRRSRSSW